MTDQPGTHTHGEDGRVYANPDELGYNDDQLFGLSALNMVISGVYTVGINPENYMDIRILDFEAGTMISATLTEDGDVMWQGEKTPTLIWGFSAIQHPHLENGSGHDLFHHGFDLLLEKFMSDEITATELIQLGRDLGRAFGIIPADAEDITL